MKLYNSMTRSKEEFIPIKDGKVKMYVCGPTVYDYFHIGNARPFIIFDVFRRYLEYKGYDVTYIQNFTDIDDKMIKNANEEGVSVKALGKKFIAAYIEDAKALNIKPADIHPRATEHISEIIIFIKGLEAKGLAYEADGDMYFDTQAYPEYGKLTGQNLDELELGSRIQIDEKKKNPMDFALWKAEKPGEPSWGSPWGKGRPGWHIECSAMVRKYLGDTIDIHAGGIDLKFPHHENEIAQSEGLTGKTFARYWIHNGYINVDNKKMSKSLNNFFTVRDVLKVFSPEVIRFFMLSAHYRGPVNYSAELLKQSESALERLYTARNNLNHMLKLSEDREMTADENVLFDKIMESEPEFERAMDDDINTADALASLFDLVKIANTGIKAGQSKKLIENTLLLLAKLSGILGILTKKGGTLTDEMKQMIAERKTARTDKNWAESDRIRDELLELGVTIEDTPQGMRWTVE